MSRHSLDPVVVALTEEDIKQGIAAIVTANGVKVRIYRPETCVENPMQSHVHFTAEELKGQFAFAGCYHPKPDDTRLTMINGVIATLLEAQVACYYKFREQLAADGLCVRH